VADGKKLWIYLGVGCGVLALLTVCGGGSGIFLFFRAMGEPVAYARGFLDDIRERDWHDALQRMNAGYQNTHVEESFRQSAESLPALVQHTDATFTSHSSANSTAQVEGNLTTPSGPIAVAMTLTKHGDHWYIDTVNVAGQPLP